MSERYVVTRPFGGSGIGSNLLSLAGAVWLAGRLDRTVIVDWRGSDFLRDKSCNFFTEFFEPVGEIQGVPVRYAPVAEADEAPGDAVAEVDASAAARIAETGSDMPFLVLTPFHGYERIERGGDPLEQFRRLRDFYEAIRPRPFVQREIDAFVERHRLDDTFVVAVNVATGNGDYARGGAFEGRVRVDIFEKEELFVRKLARARAAALRRLPRPLREGALTFVATDAAFMRDILLRLPNAITRRSVFPPHGVGRRFADYDVPGYTDRDAVVDILVDHELLAHCNAIIRNASVYAVYGAVKTTYYNGNMRDLETLYTRYRVSAVARRLRALARR